MAFGIGMIAIGAFLRRRDWLAVALVAVAAICHVTTALWFAILIGTALTIVDPRWRRAAAAGAGVALVVLAWAIRAGPLQAASTTMDAAWIEAFRLGDFIFANEWPLWVWAANLGLLAALWLAQAVRARRGTATPEDRALAWGATALVGVFLVTLPAVAAHVAVAVQFQMSRVFWVVDLLPIGRVWRRRGDRRNGGARHRRGMQTLTAVLLMVAIRARHASSSGKEHAGIRCSGVKCSGTAPWTDAMQVDQHQPLDISRPRGSGAFLEIRHQRPRGGGTRRAARGRQGFRDRDVQLATSPCASSSGAPRWATSRS